MKNTKCILLVLLLTCAVCHLHAANRFWVAAGPGNWNNSSNWSAASGGAAGASVPGAGDAVTFDNGGLGDCTIDAVVSVASINVKTTYTGTIAQGAHTISSTGIATFSGGTFSGGNADMTIGSTFTLSGTIFTSTSTTLEFRNNTAFTSGSFIHNNGSVRYNAAVSVTISGNSPVFNNLEFVGQGHTFTISSVGDITVLNMLTFSGGSAYTLNAGIIDANGDINISNTAIGCGGNGLINIAGTGTQNFNGSSVAAQGALPQLTINKSSGVLNLLNYPAVANNFTYTAGTINAGTSTFCFTRATTGAYSISGTTVFNNILFAANTALTATLAAGTVLTINDLTMTGSANIKLNTGDINVNGNIYLSNTATGGGGSTNINIIGTVNQNLDGTAIIAGQNLLPFININKLSGILSLSGNISFAGDITYVAGTIDPTTSTSTIANSLTITGNPTLYNLAINSAATINLIIAAGNTVTVANDLTLANGASNININTGTLAVQGNIGITNTATGGGGSGTVLINGGAAQQLTATGIINQGRLPAVTISKTGGILTLPSLITVRGNWTYTTGVLDVTTNNSNIVFANTLTITGSHSLDNISFDAAAGYTITLAAGTVLTALGDMSLSNTNNLTFNGGNINLNGNLNLSNTGVGGGGTTVITFTGAGNQAIVSSLAVDQSRLPAITIAKPAGILTLPAIITVRGNWTYTTGTIDVLTNNSTVDFDNTLTITGTHTLNNVLFEGSAGYNITVSTGTILGVSGTLTTNGASNININTPVAGATAIQAQGDIVINNTAAGGGGTGTILINGTGAQAFSSTAAAGQGRMPYLTIQKASGTLTLSGIISESRNWTYNNGTVDASTSSSTVDFGGNNLTVSSDGMNFYNVIFSSNTSTLTNNLSVNKDLTINGTGVLSAGTNTINLSGNWSDRATAGFTEATSTVNFMGSGLQAIASPGGENFTNININNSGAGIQLQNDATIATNLNMTQGNIDLNGNNLVLGLSVANKGTLSRVSGTIIGSGSFKRWFNTSTILDGAIAGLFPVGSATDYRPFSVSAPLTGPTAGGTMTVSYTDASTNSIVSFLDGPFTIVIRKDLNWALSTANGLAGGTYDIDAQGTGLGSIGNVNDLRLTLASSAIGVPGVNGGSTANPQVNTTGLSLANLSNSFFIGSINFTTLPVTLVSFTASQVNQTVRLDWETAAEVNNDHFTIQRSADAQHWENVKLVKGSGNSSTDSYYTAYDENPLDGISYYRLIQTDLNGKDSYSMVREVNINESVTMNIYPNPATNYITIAAAGAQKLNVSLFSSTGQKINVPSNNDANRLTLYVSGLGAGNYFIRIAHGNLIETRTITIIK